MVTVARCGVPSAGTAVGRGRRQATASAPSCIWATTSWTASLAAKRSCGAPPAAIGAGMATAIIGAAGGRTSTHHGDSSGTTPAEPGRAVDSVSSQAGQSSPVDWVTMPYQVRASGPAPSMRAS